MLVGCAGHAPAPDQPGPTATEARVVAPTALEALRIRGTRYIDPDADDRRAIEHTASQRATASFRLCIDRSGTVVEVTRRKPSGYAAYDAKVEAALWTWAYRPYLVDGTSVAACTTVTFHAAAGSDGRPARRVTRSYLPGSPAHEPPPSP